MAYETPASKSSGNKITPSIYNQAIVENFKASIPDMFITKGDLLMATGADAGSRLAVGANGTVLISDANAAAGVRWMAMNDAILARYDRTTSQTISSATSTIVDFATAVTDTHSAVTTGESWKFEAPVTGIYLVSAHVVFDASNGWNSAAYVATLRLYKNGSMDRFFDIEYPHAGGYGVGASVRLHGTVLVYLSATEYISVVVRYNNAISTLTLLGTAGYSHVSIARVF